MSFKLISLFGIFVTVFSQITSLVEAGDSQRLYEVTLTDTKDAPKVVVAELVPGKPARITLNVRNNSQRVLVFEKLSVSCGCMVIDKVKSEVADGGSIEIPINLRADFSGQDSVRTLTLVESVKSQWNIILECQFIKPILFDREKVIELDGMAGVTECRIPVDVPIKSADLVGEVEKLKCESLGSVVENPFFKRNGHETFLVFTGSKPPQPILYSNFSESIRVKGSAFAIDLKLRFHATSSIRVMPEKCDSALLKEGLIRVCVSGESLANYKHVDLIGYDKNNAVVPLTTTSIASLSGMKIFVPKCEGDVAGIVDRILVCGRVDEDSEKVSLGSVYVITGGE